MTDIESAHNLLFRRIIKTAVFNVPELVFPNGSNVN